MEPGADHKKLTQLALQHGLLLGDPRSRPTPRIISPSGKDTEDATLAAQNLRLERFNSKRHILRRKPTKVSLKGEELDATLQKLVEEDTSPQQVKAIVDMGAVVYRSPSEKKSVLHRFRRQNSVETKTAALRIAVMKRREDFVSLLTATSDQASIDEAFDVAIGNEDVASMKALLNAGADPNRHEDRLLEFVRSDRTEFVIAMGSGQKPLNPSIATSALAIAVGSHNVSCIRILLFHGGDVNCGNGAAFANAVGKNQLDTVIHMCLSPQQPSIESLHTAAELFRLGSSSSDQHASMAEVLLAAGLPIVDVNHALTRAAQIGCLRLAKLFVPYGASITHARCAAAKSALRMSNTELFDVILSAGDASSAADTLLPYTQSLRATIRTNTRVAVLTSLALLRPISTALDECLLNASRDSQSEEVEALVKGGARVDYRDGEALAIAVRRGDLPIVSLLCPRVTLQNTRLRAIAALVKLARVPRLAMAQMILADAHAISGPQIDRTLMDVVREQDLPRDYALIELLARYADVNSSRGECLKLAASWADQRMLAILQHGSLIPAIVGDSLLAACLTHDLNHRFAVMQGPSSQKATGDGLQTALLQVIDSTGDCVRFVGLLVNQFEADVDHGGAPAVLKALHSGNLSALGILLKRSNLVDTRDIALKQAMTPTDTVARPKRLRACEMILDKGTSQTSLNAALEARAKDVSVDEPLIALLLSYGAQICFRSASAVQTSITTRNLSLFKILIKSQKTTLETINVAVSNILETKDENTRLEFLKCLVDKARCDIGTTLTTFLPKSFSRRKSTASIARFFAQNGANVDERADICVPQAVSYRNLDVLDLLLEHAEKATTYVTALNQGHALPINERQVVYAIIFRRLEEKSRIRDETIVRDNISDALIAHIQEPNMDLSIINLLLNEGADVHHKQNQSLQIAIRGCKDTVLKELLEYLKRDSDIVALFKDATAHPLIWDNPGGPLVLELLIKRGARGVSLSTALLKATENYGTFSQSQSIIRLLLDDQGAGIRPHREILNVAAQSGKVDLFRELLQAKCPKSALEEAAQRLLYCSHGEAEVLEILHLIHRNRTAALNMDREIPGILPCLFQSFLRGYTVAVFDLLLKMGASPQQKASMKIDEDAGEEMTSILIYVLSRGAFVTSDHAASLIQSLLQGQGEDVNFRTPKSQLTAITVAARRANYGVLNNLVNCHADVNLLWRDMSPLYLVSSRGDSEMAQCLIEAGAEINDGSLHEAAKYCNARLVGLIIKAGHNPNHPGPLHHGRNALSTLLASDVRQGESSRDMEKTIEKLVAGKAQIRGRQNGKSLLFLAMESPQADHKTTALLSTCMGDLVNDDFNVYRHGGLTQSALGYVKRDPRFLGDAPTRVRLIQILEAYGAIDIYYNERGPQRADYTSATAPEDVKTRENQRLEREQRRAEEQEDHEDRMKRQRSEAEAQKLQQDRKRAEEQQASDARIAQRQREAQEQRRLQDQIHQQISRQRKIDEEARIAQQQREAQEQQRLQDQTHQQILKHKKADAALQQTLDQQKHKLSLAQDSERATARDKAYRNSTTLSIEMDKYKAVEHEKIAEHRRHAELEHEQGLSRVRLEEQRETNKQRRAIMSEQDSFGQRQHSREMKQIEAKGNVIKQQSNLARQQSRLFDTQKELAQLAASSRHQALEWSEDVD